MKKTRILSSVYSFLLPGLGQLYEGKALLALAFFVPFAAVLYLKAYFYFLPILSIASSAIAHQSAIEKQSPASRDWVFAITGFCAFLLWFLSFASSYYRLEEVKL